jgi:hypothetical protein
MNLESNQYREWMYMGLKRGLGAANLETTRRGWMKEWPNGDPRDVYRHELKSPTSRSAVISIITPISFLGFPI